MKKSEDCATYRFQVRQAILSVSAREFAEKGIRSVKMDDIAKKVGISKRTLYEIYTDKEGLLLEIVKENESRTNASLESFAKNSGHNVMDVILEFYHVQMERLSATNPLFYVEISKFKQVMGYLNQTRERRYLQSQDFFKRGVEEGYFRSDVDYVLVSHIGSSIMRNGVHEDIYRQYELQYIFKNTLFLFLRGFCTLKGYDYLERWLKEG